MRSLRGFVVGLAMVGMLGGVGLFSAAPASAQTSSPGCFFPCDASFIYLQSIGYFIEGGLSSDPGRCRAQCGAIRKGCHNAVTSSERCIRGSIYSAFEFDRKACGDFFGSEAECRDEINSSKQGFESFLREDVQCGRSNCEDDFEDCLLACNNDVE
jgi:hypothetical protein